MYGYQIVQNYVTSHRQQPRLVKQLPDKKRCFVTFVILPRRVLIVLLLHLVLFLIGLLLILFSQLVYLFPGLLGSILIAQAKLAESQPQDKQKGNPANSLRTVYNVTQAARQTIATSRNVAMTPLTSCGKNEPKSVNMV